MLELLMIFFLALIFATASTAIARSKGLDSKVWFLSDLLLGPFAIVWLLIKPKTEKTLAIRIGRPSHFKNDPYSADPSKTEVHICRHCQRELLLDESRENSSGGKASILGYTSRAFDILILAMMFIAFVVIAVACLALFKLIFLTYPSVFRVCKGVKTLGGSMPAAKQSDFVGDSPTLNSGCERKICGADHLSECISFCRCLLSHLNAFDAAPSLTVSDHDLPHNIFGMGHAAVVTISRWRHS